MKKSFLAIAVVGLIGMTACKKSETKVEEATQETVNDVQEAGQSIQDNVSEIKNVAEMATKVPTFSNPEVQKLAEEYSSFFNDVKAAQISGDQAKIAELNEIGNKWGDRIMEANQKMTKEDMDLWLKWTDELRAEAAGK
ncbi:MAG: hypothetical protein WDA08_01725 [Weeksellaceae bacterium]